MVSNIFGPAHEIFIAREITKIYETIYKDKVLSIIEKLELNPEEQKGEFVIILNPLFKESKNIENIILSYTICDVTEYDDESVAQHMHEEHHEMEH